MSFVETRTLCGYRVHCLLCRSGIAGTGTQLIEWLVQHDAGDCPKLT